MAYKIGSFNMFKFSFQSDSEIRKDFTKLSRIIRDNRFDIIALQEVFSPNALARLLDYLGRFEWNGDKLEDADPEEAMALFGIKDA